MNSQSRIIDISSALDAATYANNLAPSLLAHMAGKPAGFEVEKVIDHDSSFGSGQVARGVKMRLHVGSHIDAPEHWIRGGKQAYDLPLATFVGEAALIDCSRGIVDRQITANLLEKGLKVSLESRARIVIRTDWGDRFEDMDHESWRNESPYLSDDALQWCLDKKPALIGIDFYHGSKTPSGRPVERTLVSSEIVTLVNLRRLAQIEGPSFTLVALPLAIKGVEASPVRAIAIQ